MTGASNRSAPSNATTCWRSSQTATAVAARGSPARIPVDRWQDLIGEPTLADAILDRIIHNAYRLQLSAAGRGARRS